MKLTYFLPSSPYWASMVALDSWGYGWVSTGVLLAKFSIRWGVDHIFGRCTFSHEVELLFSIESILGEQGGVGIVRMRVSFNRGSFGEILRLGGCRSHFWHMRIFTWSWTTFCHRVHFGRARWRWNREDTAEVKLGFFWRSSSIRWVYIVRLVYAHFHMKLNYFLPSSPYWASKVALESWGYGWASTGVLLAKFFDYVGV